MNIRLWGTRGSIPAPGPSTVRYGGNTSCVEVRARDGSLIILDAGSGIRALGSALGACHATLMLTHYHWDHIQGLPFFGPAYSPTCSVRIIGPEFNGEGPEAYLGGQMMSPYFPAVPSQLHGVKRFDSVPEEPFEVGSARVLAGRVCHPGTTYGYRLEDGDETLVYISDNEVDAAGPELYARIVALAQGADLLLHDCQYTEGEYSAKHGWGHSTPRQAVQVARDAQVKRLMLFHHDPGHSDEQLEAMATEAGEMAGTIEIIIGKEGESTPVAAAQQQPADGRELPVQLTSRRRHQSRRERLTGGVEYPGGD